MNWCHVTHSDHLLPWRYWSPHTESAVTRWRDLYHDLKRTTIYGVHTMYQALYSPVFSSHCIFTAIWGKWYLVYKGRAWNVAEVICLEFSQLISCGADFKCTSFWLEARHATTVPGAVGFIHRPHSTKSTLSSVPSVVPAKIRYCRQLFFVSLASYSSWHNCALFSPILNVTLHQSYSNCSWSRTSCLLFFISNPSWASTLKKD